MNEQKPTRKQNRLSGFDYNNCGAYFITICTAERKNLFWQYVENESNNGVVGETTGLPKNQVLTKCGQIAKKVFLDIPRYYPAIQIDKQVVMPNHIHMILSIKADSNGRPMVAPTISTVIQQAKGIITKQVGYKVFQKSFYDHVIRNKQDYDSIWQYIDTNPLKWCDDELFFEE